MRILMFAGDAPVSPLVGALCVILGFAAVVVVFALFLTYIRKNKK